ncbi:MAG: hypothetical protein ACRDLN_05500 [Solirubrobacteraceae bacterium]
MAARLATLQQGERIVLVGGLLLAIDLLFLPWHSIDLDGLTATGTAVQSPYSGYGVAALILVLVMVLQIAVSKLLGADLPAPGVPWGQIQLVAGVFVLVVLVVKLARFTEYLGYGAYSGVLAGLLVAYGGYLVARESTVPA